MKADFAKSVYFGDLQLPPYLKEQLWRCGLVACKPIMDILAVACRHCSENNEQQLRQVVQDAIIAHDMAQAYRNEFFAYKNGKIPDDVFYHIVGRDFIDLIPEAFPNISDDYHGLRSRVFYMDQNPESYLSAKMDGPAKYAYAIGKYLELNSLCEAMRSNIDNVAAPHVIEKYNSLVPVLKKIMLGTGELSHDVQLTGRKADFILNNFGTESAWYIEKGAREYSNISDPRFIFDNSELAGIEYARGAFYQAYQNCEGRTQNPGLDTFYEFAEAVINPMNLVAQAVDSIEPPELMYMLARLGTTHENSEQASSEASAQYPVSEDFIKSVDLALYICEFHHRTTTLWGPRVVPFIFTHELIDYSEELESLEKLNIENQVLRQQMLKYQRLGCFYYNVSAKENAVLGFETRTPPLAPRQPSNDPN